MSDKGHSVKSIFFGPIVVLGLTAAYLAVGWSSPQSVGYWRDDGIYVSNARALAEGHGYRRVAMPEAPLETQKPIAWPGGVFLATGRQGYGAWPDKRPYEVNYSPERSFADFYSIPAPSESEFRPRDIRENLLAVYRAANVDYYVAYTGYGDTPHIERLIRDHPAAFTLRFTSPKKTIRVYRVHPSPADPQENATK